MGQSAGGDPAAIPRGGQIPIIAACRWAPPSSSIPRGGQIPIIAAWGMVAAGALWQYRDMSDDAFLPDAAEQLDQLQPDATLIDRGVADVLDEGYIAPDGWSVLQTYGNTAQEMRQGESLERRLAAELPDLSSQERVPWRPEPGEAGQVGSRRAGRLVALADGSAPDTFATDVGVDGGGASAEEAAVHIIDSATEAQFDD